MTEVMESTIARTSFRRSYTFDKEDREFKSVKKLSANKYRCFFSKQSILEEQAELFNASVRKRKQTFTGK